TANDDQLSFVSNIGARSVDVGAPGHHIYSTVTGGAYDYLTGTSMATGYATGVVALLRGRRPDLGWSQVKDRLLATTRPLASLQGRTLTGGILDAAAAVGDCNGNAVADELDIAQGASHDCDGSGIPDECEVDCNGNGLADNCDIAAGGGSADCDGNLVPDECDVGAGAADCNHNGVPDDCDLTSGVSSDVNGSGVPDECELCDSAADCDDGNFCTDESCVGSLCHWQDRAGPCDDGDDCTGDDRCVQGACRGDKLPTLECAPLFSMRVAAVGGRPLPGGPADQVTAARGDRITLEIYLERWDPVSVQAYNARIDLPSLASAATGRLEPVIDPAPQAGAFIDRLHPRYVFQRRTSIPIVTALPEVYQYAGLILFPNDCARDDGAAAYLGTLLVEVGDTAAGTFTVCLDPDTDNATFLLDCPLPDQIRLFRFDCASVSVPVSDCDRLPDCNGNGLWDICDIAEGRDTDCNDNDSPDLCDVDSGLSEDCNANRHPDECDLNDDVSADCNLNDLPDECEPQQDCNANGTQDICDIFAGTVNDCNGNGIPDECELFYVDASAPAGGDGRSWASAFRTLTAALEAASAGCGPGIEIWVAEGIYTPGDAGGSRAASFELVSGVEVYGGFAGSETLLEERRVREHVTVLSGDLAGDDGTLPGARGENSYHVVRGTDADRTARLDGFIITAGLADGPGEDADGAGLLAVTGAPRIVQCTFVDNLAAGHGGAAACGGRTDFVNCLFVGNHADGHGGAVYLPSGGARFTNCVFSGNSADGSGGALRHVTGNPQVFGCTIGDNLAQGAGGGIYSGDAAAVGGRESAIPSFVEVVNSILWGNRAGGGSVGGQAGQFSADVPSFWYSCVEGPAADLGGEGNIQADPFFVDPLGSDGQIGTPDDDLRLAPGSPAIDAGINDVVDGTVPDLAGQERVQFCRVDMGAYEAPTFADCDGSGSADACDVNGGLAVDCNLNLVPDTCESDCNGNGAADDCDIAYQVSDDCNGNEVPDECEPDCNASGRPDICDITSRESLDCNVNGIPDECELAAGLDEDCNGNAVLDSCEVVAGYSSLAANLRPFGAGQAKSHTLVRPPLAVGSVTLVLVVRADLGNTEEYVSVFMNGVAVGRVFESTGTDCPGALEFEALTVPRDLFNAAASTGTVVFDIVASDAVDAQACGSGTSLSFVLRYQRVGPGDCNANATPDDCEVDTDDDGRIDECDGCPLDPAKVDPGQCGCGNLETDADGDTVADCVDLCPFGDDTIDDNEDGRPDCNDAVPAVGSWGLIVLALLLLTGAKLGSQGSDPLRTLTTPSVLRRHENEAWRP
ncbi:MAG: S8 family serine peptidase, partial [Planctomycetes bacterium]|nr:S8 family serine peptidase [Planctomycetota bacterium]